MAALARGGATRLRAGRAHRARRGGAGHGHRGSAAADPRGDRWRGAPDVTRWPTARCPPRRPVGKPCHSTAAQNVETWNPLPRAWRRASRGRVYVAARGIVVRRLVARRATRGVSTGVGVGHCGGGGGGGAGGARAGAGWLGGRLFPPSPPTPGRGLSGGRVRAAWRGDVRAAPAGGLLPPRPGRTPPGRGPHPPPEG